MDGYNNWIDKNFKTPNNEYQREQWEREKKYKKREGIKTMLSSTILPLLLGSALIFSTIGCLIKSCETDSEIHGKNYPIKSIHYNKGLEEISFD